jgi:two-component system chemotaxis response regulator CheB
LIEENFLIRVLLVDDSKIALAVLKKILSLSPEIEIAGTAENGAEALKAVLSLKPDVICSDYQMPVMDGLEFTRQVMRLCPTPILILSIAVQSSQQDNVFKLLDAGAVDILPKPCLDSGLSNPALGQALIAKIRLLSGVKVFTRKSPASSPIQQLPATRITTRNKNTLIVIGASTGGPQALEKILSKLPKDYPFTIVCVQHISKGFLDSFVGWMNAKSKLAVSIAKQGEVPQKGRIYFAPDNGNLIFNAKGSFEIKQENENLFFPSVDATFFSISRQLAPQTIAVLLTGMGSDGAKGLKAISDAGGLTVAQDEASCTIFGMPKVAIELGAAKKILSLEAISQLLCSLV